jgi:hypothetical protein
MKMELTNLEEQPDGSAICTLDMDAEGLQFLVNVGLVTVLREAIDKHKDLKVNKDE